MFGELEMKYPLVMDEQLQDSSGGSIFLGVAIASGVAIAGTYIFGALDGAFEAKAKRRGYQMGNMLQSIDLGFQKLNQLYDQQSPVVKIVTFITQLGQQSKCKTYKITYTLPNHFCVVWFLDSKYNLW